MKTNCHVLLAISATLVLAADANAGRWLSRDPIQDGAGFVQRDPMEASPNLYGFVGNDPANTIDPLGLDFIAVGDRWVTFLPGIARHMSIEFYEEPCPATREGHRFTPRTIPAGAHRSDQYELIPQSHTYRYFFNVRPHPGSPLQQTFVWENISEILNSSRATQLIVIYSDYPNGNGDAARRWRTIANAAQNYPYAEHPVGPFLQNWPNSKYQFPWENPGNNSNTFIREMARSVGRSADVLGGNHPGAKTAGPVRDPGSAPTYSPWP